jgi:hypothetical protein
MLEIEMCIARAILLVTEISQTRVKSLQHVSQIAKLQYSFILIPKICRIDMQNGKYGERT